jgi:drug/metabolite transporter (DMT)-like permease
VDLVLIAIAVCATSTSAPLVREAAAPALVSAFWRNALATAVLVPTALVQRREEVDALSRRERRLIAIAGMLLAAHFATWIPSLSYTTVASSVALVCTQPVWAALLARANGEHVSRQTWIGIAVAFAGVLALTGVDLTLSSRAVFGDVLAVLGGVLAAAYVTVGATVRRTVSTTTYTAGCYGVASIALLALCAFGGRNLTNHDATTWWCLVAITVGPQLLGHSLLNRVLQTTSATIVSVALLFEIVGATLLARWWFGEAPPGGTYPAAVLIACGIVLVVRDAAGPASRRRIPVSD